MTTGNRERQAVREMQATQVSHGVGIAMVAALLGIIWLPFAGELLRMIRPDTDGSPHSGRIPVTFEILPLVADALAPIETESHGLVSSVRHVNRRLLEAFHEYEDRLKDAEWLPRTLRPPVLRTMFVVLKHAGEKAYVGRNGWLFYRADADSVCTKGFLDPARLESRRRETAKQGRPTHPDPRPAILDFRAQLARRHIHLVLLPTPVKAVAQAERLAAGAETGAAVHNASFAAFVRTLRDAGVQVLEPSAMLASFQAPQGVPAYLETDTHWRPEAVDRVARLLAETVRPRLSASAPEPVVLRRARVKITNYGDIVGLLGFPAAGQAAAGIQPETVNIREVHDEYGALWQPSRDAEVLLLGDSFTNIYSLDGMGWGRGAGLAEQLAYHLGRPVDRIARNDNGAFATRQSLAHDLAVGRDRLAGKKVVIWQFATRELCYGDWQPVDLDLRPPVSTQFLSVEPGAALSVSGTVAAASPVPAPGSVPYKDHIRAVHLVDLTGEGTAPGVTQAVVYLESMHGNTWTPAAGLRVGDSVRLRLQCWADVADRYRNVNRTELEDVALQLQQPCWGVLETSATGSCRELHYGGWTTWVALLIVAACLASRGLHTVVSRRHSVGSKPAGERDSGSP